MYPQVQREGDTVIDNDFATVAGSPRPLTVSGTTYYVHPLTFGDYGKLQAWLETQIPDPVAVAVRNCTADVPIALQKHMISEALAIASKPRIKLGTPEADVLLNSFCGVCETLIISIQKGDPTFSREAAERLFSSMTTADLAKTFTYSAVDMVMSGGDPDPKAVTT